MQQDDHKNHHLSFICVCILCTGIVACTPSTDNAVTTVESTPSSTVPTEVIVAQEAVLDFLRDGANECVPPEMANWRSESGRAPDGFGVYRFHSDECLMTVAYSLQASTATYHVALHNGMGGFCWQAIVNDHGGVVATGSAAELMPELADAASGYCEGQGYEYEVQEQPGGGSCGVCTFPDNSSCKAWLFYQGECGPVEATTEP